MMKVNRFLYAENRNIPVQEEDAWGSSSPAFLSLRRIDDTNAKSL